MVASSREVVAASRGLLASSREFFASSQELLGSLRELGGISSSTAEYCSYEKYEDQQINQKNCAIGRIDS
jgi:hypothetical protein